MTTYTGALRIGAIAAAALTMAACSKSSTANSTTTTAAATATTAAAPNTTGAPSTTAAPAAPAGRKVTGTLTTLGAGTFAGGKDVPVGLYDVTPGAGQSGNFSVSGTDSYNEVLGNDASLGVPVVRAQISNGDQIQISSLSAVTFTPVTAPLVTSHTPATIYAGTWVVGKDVGAGRYVAAPGAGQSGNFSVSGGSYTNEILGTDASMGAVPQVTVNLSDGNVISVSSLSQVTLTPS